jgi:hypothetical protein
MLVYSLSKIPRVFILIIRWLGKNSTTRKIKRELKELKYCMGNQITGSNLSIKMDYVEPLFKMIIN